VKAKSATNWWKKVLTHFSKNTFGIIWMQRTPVNQVDMTISKRVLRPAQEVELHPTGKQQFTLIWRKCGSRSNQGKQSEKVSNPLHVIKQRSSRTEPQGN